MFLCPPPIVECLAFVMLQQPPATVEIVPDVVLRVPPPIIEQAPDAVLVEPPPIDENVPVFVCPEPTVIDPVTLKFPVVVRTIFSVSVPPVPVKNLIPPNSLAIVRLSPESTC